MKKLVLHFLIIGIFFAATSVSKAYIDLERGGIGIETQKIEYTLPYPGLLPDSPLYAVKVFRDHLWLFLTRDNMKKAELLLLFSDKKISAAQALAKKGKWDMSSGMMSEAEQDFKRMVATLVLSQQAGVSSEDTFKMKTILSNKKHHEVIEDLLSNSPQGSRNTLEDAVELNASLTQKLQELFQ